MLVNIGAGLQYFTLLSALSERNVKMTPQSARHHAKQRQRRMTAAMQQTALPSQFQNALTTNRRPGSYTPMVGASHLHTFGVCSDHMRTQQRTWFLSSAVVHLGGVRPLHRKQVRKEFSPHPVSNFQRGEKAEGSSKEHFLPPVLAPKQPAIHIMTAMDFKDG